MNAKRLGRMAGCFGCLLTGALNAEVVWTGAVNGTWDTSTPNWRDGASEAVFAPGADARFDDSALSTDVSISGNVSAGTVVFDNVGINYLLKDGGISAATEFVKRGSGTLRITGKNHAFTGDMLVEGGELIADVNNDVMNATSGALGNPRAVRTITVTNGASLTFRNKNPFGGGGTSGNRILTALNIVGGTLNLTYDFANNLGPVIFDNATLTYSGGLYEYGSGVPKGRDWANGNGGGNRYWGTAMFGSNVVFRGTNVYDFPVVGNVYKSGFTFGKYEPSDIFVEDITGDSRSDVIFRLPIGYTPTAAGQTPNGVNTRFNKKGPGTLELAYGENFYTGDVSVVEGALYVTGRYVSQTAPFSGLGNPRVPHRLYVGPDATLHFGPSDIMGQAYSRSLITIEVNGGTLKQSAGSVNSFGPLILNNAKLDYAGHAAQNITYDIIDYYTNAVTTITVSNRVVSTTIGGDTSIVTNQLSSSAATAYISTPIDAISAQYTNRVSVVHTNLIYESGLHETTEDGATVLTSTNAFQMVYTNVVTPRVTTWAVWGTFFFDGDVAFKGTNAYTLANKKSDNRDSFIRCGINGMVYFAPDDITGNAAPDVIIDMRIDDGPVPYQNFLRAPVSNFGKKGAGTLRLTHHGSTFSGDIDVAEGVLEVYASGNQENKTYSGLGNPQVADRKMLIRDGGEVYFPQGDTLGQLASWVKLETVVSNATLRIGNNTCNGFGPLTLYNANIVYNGGASGTRRWGSLGFGSRVTFDGTAPYAFPVVGNNCWFSLGYATDHVVEPAGTLTNYHGKTEFLVRDITGDAQPDVVMGVPLQDIPDWAGTTIFKGIRFKCGLLKTGEGTLNLTSGNSEYTGPTVVREGTLRVDGALTASAVTVAAGGYLGGTGSVASVTLEDGAGFEVLSDQVRPLNVDALTAAGGVTVRVRNPGGLAAETLNAPVAKVAGGTDISGWTVAMDGVAPTPNLRVKAGADGIVYARWSPQGTVLGLR